MTPHLKGIILFARSVDLLKTFYSLHFHFTIAEEIPGAWILLRSGTFELGLHKAAEEYVSLPGGAHGNNVKFVFDTEEDLQQLHGSFQQQGIPVREIQSWNDYPYHVFDGEDPEGNMFQVRAVKS